jgi:hypothetical protein
MKQAALALIDLVISLELAPDELIDLDFEVEMMEQVASVLQAMPEREKKEFLRLIRERADASKDLKRRELLEQMPEALGLD